jgi:hypothetical protein
MKVKMFINFCFGLCNLAQNNDKIQTLQHFIGRLMLKIAER